MSSISSSRMRITGSSGMDIESMVSQLMKAESMKLDTANKKLTKLAWKQEAYRETSNSIRAFRDTYLSFTTPKTNYRATTMYNTMKISTTVKGSETKAINVVATGSAKPAEHTINVEQVAKNDVYVSGTNLSGTTSASSAVDVSKVKAGYKFDVTLDGVTKTIEINRSFTDADDLVDVINDQLKEKFGMEKSLDSKEAKVLASIDSSGKLSIGTAVGGHTLKISKNASTEYIYSNTKKITFNDAQALLNSGESFTLEINGQDYKIDLLEYKDKNIEKDKANEILSDAIKAALKDTSYSVSVNGGEITINNTAAKTTDFDADALFTQAGSNGNILELAVNNKQFTVDLSAVGDDPDKLAKAINDKLGDNYSAEYKDGKVRITDKKYDTTEVKIKTDTESKSISLELGDENKEISLKFTSRELSKIGDDSSKLADALTKKLKEQGLSYTATVDDGKIVIKNDADETVTINGDDGLEPGDLFDEIESAPGMPVTIDITSDLATVKNVNISNESVLLDLGFSSADLETTSFEKQSISSMFDFGNSSTLDIKINEQTITLKKSMSVNEMMLAINESGAGVKMSYSSLTGTVKMEAAETGEINAIRLDSRLEKAFSLTRDEDKGGKTAQDAVLWIDGVKTSRASNSFDFEEDGLKITLTNESEQLGEIKISSKHDTDTVLENIKAFVEQYNNILSLLQGKVSETRAKSAKYTYYEPLTDEERSAISDKDAELWDAKAKEGLLYRDDAVSKIISDLRTNMFNKVDLGDGKSITLYEIGISATDWRDKGKLTINEDKLRAALEERPGDVTKLFTQSSSILMSDSANRSQRLKEEGLAERLNDIIDDAIRIQMNAAGKRGTLVEKAGEKNSASESENYMYKQIKAQSDKIDRLIESLTKKEENYYRMFSAMENAVNKSNSQMSYLSQQFSS